MKRALIFVWEFEPEDYQAAFDLDALLKSLYHEVEDVDIVLGFGPVKNAVSVAIWDTDPMPASLGLPKPSAVAAYYDGEDNAVLQDVTAEYTNR